MYDQYVNQSRLLLKVLPLIKKYPHFALKGGTAINFFIRNFPRLSVDIDLCYIKINSRDEALSEITSSMEDLKAEIERRFQGSRVVVKRTPSEAIRGMVVQSDGVTIKIEPNPVIRGTVHPPEIKPLSERAADFFGMEIDFPVLSKPDLYGGKICAALDRQHPRDLFDVHMFLEQKEFDRSVFEAFLVYLISHPRPMVEVINPNLKDISDSYEKEFRTMTDLDISLDQLLRTRDELIETIRSSFNDDDKKFLLSLKENKPQWDLLNVRHTSSMPAVIWKCMNIGKMKDDEREKAKAKLKKAFSV